MGAGVVGLGEVQRPGWAGRTKDLKRAVLYMEVPIPQP